MFPKDESHMSAAEVELRRIEKRFIDVLAGMGKVDAAEGLGKQAAELADSLNSELVAAIQKLRRPGQRSSKVYDADVESKTASPDPQRDLSRDVAHLRTTLVQLQEVAKQVSETHQKRDLSGLGGVLAKTSVKKKTSGPTVFERILAEHGKLVDHSGTDLTPPPEPTSKFKR